MNESKFDEILVYVPSIDWLNELGDLDADKRLSYKYKLLKEYEKDLVNLLQGLDLDIELLMGINSWIIRGEKSVITQLLSNDSVLSNSILFKAAKNISFKTLSNDNSKY